MTTFSAQPPCTLRLSGEWRFVFTAEAEKQRFRRGNSYYYTVLINYPIAQRVMFTMFFRIDLFISKINSVDSDQPAVWRFRQDGRVQTVLYHQN